MSNRHSNALAIQLGACNPSGIAYSIVEACREIKEEPGFTGTQMTCLDPAVRLMVHQLAFICGIINGAEEFAHKPSYSDAIKACKDAVANKRHTVSGSDAAEDDDLTTENTHA